MTPVMFWLDNNMNEGTHIRAFDGLQKLAEQLSSFFTSHRNLRLRLVVIKASYQAQLSFFATAADRNMNTRVGKQ